MGSSPPSSSSSVEDVVELMQNIQSRLPVEDAARTSVLSKSWLRAWSTIPTLRFHVHEEEHMKVVDVERTLSRYLRDNIPIESFELDVYIRNGEAASVTENWIQSVATKAASSLQQLSLSVELTGRSTLFTLPDEILSVAKNLTKLRVSVTLWEAYHYVWKKTPVNSVINCVSLREVVLSGVCISQELLDGIFSSCSLLEKIDLSLNYRYEYDYEDGDWKALNTMIKIRNLARLHEIRIYSEDGDSTDLEISGVPNLRLFRCDLSYGRPFSTYSISFGNSVTELWFGGLLITDESSLEMIESGFPFLESLTLDIKYWPLSTFHFTCGSLKKLSLMFLFPHMLMDVQVNAPKLHDVLFEGYTLPAKLSFPVSTLVQTTFDLALNPPVDASFFLNMRKTLMLSTKCDLCVLLASETKRYSIVDLGDLRTRLPFPPANNVQRLEFQTKYDDEYNLLFFDPFFEICHPKHVWVWASGPTNHFYKLMVMVMEGLKKKNKKAPRRSPYWAHYLKDVEIRNDEEWETLKDSHRTYDWRAIHYKLNWG